MLKQLVRCSLAASAVLLWAGSAVAQDVTGAGASFPAPIYAKWADAYNKATNVRINYQSVGSGAGLRQIRGKTVDFGASDMPLTDAELAKDGLMQFPTVIGGVVPVINVKGIAPDVLRHRIITTFEAEADEVSSEHIVKHLLDHLTVP